MRRGFTSPRRTVAGSTPAARRAGMAQATSATTARVSVPRTKVAGSVGWTPNSSVRRNRVTTSAPARPMTPPISASRIPCRTISPNTLPRWAPSASRTPISRVRRATE